MPNTYWGEIPQTEFRQLLNQIEQSNDFYTSVLNFFSTHSRKDLYPYISDVHGRSLWHRFLQIPPTGGVAIDLGAGLGAISEFLSRNYQTVQAVEGCQDRCEFLTLRKRLNNLNNVHILHHDIYDLPFASNSADLVACNGVLEWAGLSRPGKVRQIQLDFLKETNRVLKDDGVLYIGIENRFARAYFKGKLKDHSGHHYTSLVPRFFASRMCRTKSAVGSSGFAGASSEYGNYRTYTYSLRGYRSLLKQAGFNFVHFVCAEPSYDLPRFGFSIDTPLHQLKQFAQTFGLPDLTQWTRRYLCTNFLIFASRAPIEGRMVHHPLYFGYFDQMHIKHDAIHRTDYCGKDLVEPINPGNTVLKPLDPTVTTDQIIAAYEKAKSKSFPCVATSSDFEQSWKSADSLLSQFASRIQLQHLRDLILRQHVNRLFHGDFWLGNLVRNPATHTLTLIDPEPHPFGSPQLDAVDFILDLTMNDRLKSFPHVDINRLAAHFNIDPTSRDLLGLAILRQVLRYSPFHRADRQVYRWINLLKKWSQESTNLLAAA